MVFDGFRRSFDTLLARATKPEERHLIASRMKDTLVQARIGLADLRAALETVRRQAALDEHELETVRRRKSLAEGINDAETVGLAAKYEQMHLERLAVLHQKIGAQEAEVSLAEREVAEMTAELKGVVAGTDTRGSAPAVDAPGGDSSIDAADLHEELGSLSRARERADREADAGRRLDELKKRMGK